MTAGRKPLPSNVHYLHGNPSKKSAADLRDGFKPEAELPKYPRFMALKGDAAVEARNEYNRLGEQLVRYGLVSALDRGALAMAAIEWGIFVWAMKRIYERNALDEKGEAGLIDVTATGYRQQSVELSIARKAEENYLKFCAVFGLTPSDRARVNPGTSGQLALPGVPTEPEKPRLADFR